MDPVSKAQNSPITRLKGHRWEKGQSGNPGGRPKKNHVTKMYEKILAKPHNRRQIEESFLKILTGGRMSAVLMAREIAERTEGKVVQPVEMDIQGSISLETVLEAKKKAGK